MNKTWSLIVMATVFTGVALGFQSTSAPSTDDGSITVGPPKKIDPGPAAEAGRLGMAEYFCHWTRFHAAVMIMFTDAAIELSENVEGMRDITSPDELEALVLEFTESNWDEYGRNLGGIALANGLDSRMDWMIFGRSAGAQLFQYVLSGNNNWPAFGRRMADQAMSMARHGHDQRWIEFSRNLGTSLGRGTPEQWTQWGLQLALQARAMSEQPSVDWNEFASDVATQAKWLSKSMKPMGNRQNGPR